MGNIKQTLTRCLKMQYELKILDFTKDVRGFKIGTCDIRVIYSDEKDETFRNIGVFNKENKRWVSFPKTKREIKDEVTGEIKTVWLLTYERNPPIDKGLYAQVLEELEMNYL